MSDTTQQPVVPASTRSPARFPTLPPALWLYLETILIFSLLTIVAVVCYHFTSRMLAAQLWSGPADNFGDFWHYKKLFVLFHTQAFFDSADRFAYPAPCAILYFLLYRSSSHPHFVFDAITLLVYLASGFVFYSVLLKFGLQVRQALSVLAVLMLTSYPWHTLYDRGNLELFVYVFLATGVWAYLTGRSSLAAVLWGFAGALKIYPIVMLAVFLHKKRRMPLAIGVLTFAGVLLASFWFVGPTIKSAALGSLNGVFGFLGHYAASARREELNLDHSILGATKEILSLNMFHLGENWASLSKYYQILVVIGFPVLLCGWIRKLPALNQICLFLLAIVLLPPVSYDYTLIHTYLAMGIVLCAYLYTEAHGLIFPAAKTYFITFALIATPQTWVQHNSGRFNGVIKCISLLTICVLLLRYPLHMGAGAEVEEA